MTRWVTDTNYMKDCKPVYEEMKGWQKHTREEWRAMAKRGYKALPPEMQAYIKRIEDLAGIPAILVSVGPGRDETIIIEDIFKS